MYFIDFIDPVFPISTGLIYIYRIFIFRMSDASTPTPAATEASERRGSIERVLLAGLADRGLNANRLSLEVQLMATESGRERLFTELKKEVYNRDKIINTLREAYLRDVITIKEQLVRDAAERDEQKGQYLQLQQFQRQLVEQASSAAASAQPPSSVDIAEDCKNAKVAAMAIDPNTSPRAAAPPSKKQPFTPNTSNASNTTRNTKKSSPLIPTPTPAPAHARGLPISTLADKVPSLDFTRALRFFTPHDSHELIFDPCRQCGGTIQLRVVPPPTDFAVRALRLKLEKLHKAELDAKDKKIKEVQQGGKYLAETLRAQNLKLEADLQRTDADRRIAFATVAKLRKTPQYDQVVNELARLRRFSDEESTRFKEENETNLYKISNLETQVAEFKRDLAEVRSRCDNVTNENRARSARIAQLDESLAASKARNQEKAETIEQQKKELQKRQRKITEAKDETTHVRESMEMLRENMTKIVKKAERRVKLAEGQKDFLEASLKAERKERILERMASTVNRWRVASLRNLWSRWRHEAFAGGAADDRARKELEERERAEVEAQHVAAMVHKDKEIDKWRGHANRAVGAAELICMRAEEVEQRRTMIALSQRENNALARMRYEEVHSRCVQATLELRATARRLFDVQSECHVLRSELRLANDPRTIELHVESATIIQGYWRGFLARRDAVKMTAEDKMRALDAILTIGMAGTVNGEHQEKVNLDCVEDENIRKVLAAGVIQSNWRRWWGREQMRRRALSKEELLKMKSTAATLMQSLFRGMRGKRGAAVLRRDRDAEAKRKENEARERERERQLQADQMRAAQSVFRALRRAHGSVQARALRSWYTWCIWQKQQLEGVVLQEKLQSATKEMRKAQKEAKNAWKAHGEMAAELDDMTRERDAFQVRTRDAEQRCKSLQKMVTKYADRQRELDEEITMLKNEVGEAATREEGLRNEIVDLNKDLERLRQLYKELQQKSQQKEAQLQARLEVSIADWQRAEQKRGVLAKQLAEEESEVVRLGLLVKTKERQMEKMQEDSMKDVEKINMLLEGVDRFAQTVLELEMVDGREDGEEEVSRSYKSSLEKWRVAWRKGVGGGIKGSLFYGLNLDKRTDLSKAEMRLGKLTGAIAGMLGTVAHFTQTFDEYQHKHFHWAHNSELDAVGCEVGGAFVEIGNLVEFAPVKINPKIRGTVLKGMDMLRRRLGHSGKKFAGYGRNESMIKEKNAGSIDCASSGRPLSAPRGWAADELTESSPIRSRETRSPAGVAAWESPSRRPGSRGGKHFLLAPIPHDQVEVRDSGLTRQHFATQRLDTDTSSLLTRMS